MVAIDPSLPWDITLHTDTTSGPRISPTITRSGEARNAARTNSACEIAPSPSVLASRACHANTSGCASASSPRPSSNASSMVTSRSHGSISLANAINNVVLPTPGPPAITMFNRARTAAAKNAHNLVSTVPSVIRSSRVTRR